MIQSLLNEKVRVMRRVSTGIDSLGNPIYGDSVTGSGWNIVYPSMPCRLAFINNKIEFAMEAERVRPTGTLYYSQDYVLLAEDRVITAENIQYVVTSTAIGYKTGAIIDHFEAMLDLV